MSSRPRTLALLALNVLAITALVAMPRLAVGQNPDIPPGMFQPCCASGKQANFCCTDCCSKKSCETNKQCNPPVKT